MEDDEDEDDQASNKKAKNDQKSSEDRTPSTPLPAPPPQAPEVLQPVDPNAIKQPCILIFDSLAGANRARIVATLRDYLTVEYKIRKGSERAFNRDTMKGACPRVPQQMNYSDCGIFTLQFAESFFERPLKDYSFPIRTLNEWFSQDIVAGKREATAKLIKNLMDKHNPKHGITLPDIFFSSLEDKKDKTKNSKSEDDQKDDDKKKIGVNKDGDDNTSNKGSNPPGNQNNQKDLKRPLEKNERSQVMNQKIIRLQSKVIPQAPKSSTIIEKRIIKREAKSVTPPSKTGDVNQSQNKDSNNDATKENTTSPQITGTGLSFLQTTYTDDLDENSNDGTVAVESDLNGIGSTLSMLKNHMHNSPRNKVSPKVLNENQKPRINGIVKIESDKVTNNVSQYVIHNVKLGQTKNLEVASVALPKGNKKICLQKQSVQLIVSNSVENKPTTTIASSNSNVKATPVVSTSPKINSSQIRIPIGSSPSHEVTTGNNLETHLYDEDTNDVLIVVNNDKVKPLSPSPDYNLVEEAAESKQNEQLVEKQPTEELSIETEIDVPSSSRSVSSIETGKGMSPKLISMSPCNSRSNSPTTLNVGTPSVFKFSERGTASGRTIAPPKRYLDSDEDKLIKKKNKNTNFKPRNLQR